MLNTLQRGFSLISAIFLLVVLAGLGAVMVTFSTAQHQSLAIDLLGSRAYQAAQAGIEWAAYNISVNPTAAVPTTTIALGGDLAPFTVVVSDVAVSHTDAIDTGKLPEVIWMHDVTSTATLGTVGTPSYVERVVTAKIR